MNEVKYIQNETLTKHPDLNMNFRDLDDETSYFQDPKLYRFAVDGNEFMELAKQSAIDLSLTSVFPIGIVAEKNGRIIARAGNGNGYHENNFNTPKHRKGCIRRYLNDERGKIGLAKFKSGEGFELCPGCHSDSHAEANLIKVSLANNKYDDLKGANVYMYGHFWCCKDCWTKMIDAGIENVYLARSADNFKNKEFVRTWAEEVANKKSKKII